MGKGEEINKFLSGANFDNQYFNSLLKFFDYPETLKKIKENKGIITKGMKGVSNLYNYFLGNKNNNNNEREDAKKIFEKTDNLTKKIQKYSSTLEEVKIIYNSFIEEYNEKKIPDTFLNHFPDTDAGIPSVRNGRRTLHRGSWLPGSVCGACIQIPGRN